MVVIFTTMATYVIFGLYCVLSWGDKLTTPLITDMLPSGAVSDLVRFLFALNLIFSFPLILYPANLLLENYIYKNWGKSKKRQWSKNFTRMILVGLTVLLTILLG